jgi:hypothetical protein
VSLRAETDKRRGGAVSAVNCTVSDYAVPFNGPARTKHMFRYPVAEVIELHYILRNQTRRKTLIADWFITCMAMTYQMLQHYLKDTQLFRAHSMEMEMAMVAILHGCIMSFTDKPR